MLIEMPQTFWMVWSPRSKHMPKFKHETFSSAVTEADRLSELFPGRHFYVLECLGFAMKGDEIPTEKQAARAAKAKAMEMEG